MLYRLSELVHAWGPFRLFDYITVRAILAGVAQHGRVEGRHQRRALSAGGDVAAAEIGHHVAVACVGTTALRRMPHRSMIDGFRAKAHRSVIN